MKALTLVDKKKFEIIEKDIPKAEGNKVVIKVKNTGICGSDIHMIWQTGYNAGTNFVIGHEFAGEIYDAGNSTTFKVGDRVVAMEIDSCLKDECEFCGTGRENICDHVLEGGPGIGTDGGYGQYVAVREDMVRLLPDNVTFESGAMVEPAAVGLRAADLANVKKGDKCLVIGGGIIGLLTAEFLKLKGASYVALTETNELRGKKSVKLGAADEYFNALDPKLMEKLYAKTNNNGFDIVCDCCGNSAALTSGIIFTKSNGNLILVGISLNNVSIPLVAGVMKEINIKGSIAYKREEFDAVIDLLAKKRINLEKYIDDIATLDDLQASFERLTSGQDDAVKILIDPNKHKIVEL